MFSSPTIPSNLIQLPTDEGEEEPHPRKCQLKRRARVYVGLIHIIEAVVLLAGSIIAFYSSPIVLNWCFLHLLPLIIFNLLLENFHLICGYTPVWIAKRFGGLIRLGSRAVLYLVIALLVLVVAATMMGRVWILAIFLLILGVPGVSIALLLLDLARAAERCGFTDWVEQPIGKQHDHDLLPAPATAPITQEEVAVTSGA